MRRASIRNGAVLLACLLSLAACGRPETPASDRSDVRAAMAVEYVGADKMAVRAQPNDSATVITSYRNGESVSVLSKKDGWAEIRTGTGTGWAKESDLQDAAESSKSLVDNLTPRFRKAPEPVTQTVVHGEIVLEASVNSDGQVTSVRTITNTTGSTPLEVKNTMSLQGASFYPIVQHGKRREFVYEYRVHY